MKLTNIFTTVAFTAAALLLFGCKKGEELHEARAVAASETYVEFAAINAPEQVISVYADGSWAVDVDADWLAVSPMSGNGPADITIEVEDNATSGVMDMPRNGKITIQGGSRERNAVVTVHQNGDTYFGVQEYTLAEVAALDDEAVAKVVSAQVVALSKNGFVVTDESASLYVQGSGLALGDVISFNGAKTTVNEAPAFIIDEVEVKENKAVVYPEAKDITATLADYDPKVTELISLSASLVGTSIWVNANVQIPILDPLESLNLGALDLHKVVFTGYGVGASMLVISVEDGGVDEALIPYPLKFLVRVDGINYTSATWSETSKIQPVQGLGYIEYVPFDLANTDGNQKYKLDVSDKSPRVTGPWPGDYWLFYGNGAIPAGSEVRIAFESRTSATGHKYWLLEFLDGSEWRPACETFTTNDPGEEVIYSHAMNADGATNVQADYVVKYRKNTEHAQFRFRCMANWQASGAGKLAARNGGSARLTVTDTADGTYQPTIEIIKEGNGVEKDPVYANIEVSTDLLTFNGTPGDPKTITVKSDYDFTISTSADWLSLDVEEGLAGEETAIQVTCAQSELAELRQGTIKIVSEDSEKVINVVQSAAGQQLDPFISISSGNSFNVLDAAGTKTVRIQSNIEVTAESLADWITVEKLEGKGLVEWAEYVLTYSANEVETPREGQVRFFNADKNLEALVTITQAGKEPEPEYPEGVYFQDDFEWFKDIADAAGAGDGVGTQASGATAPNVYTFDATGSELFLGLFAAKGYEDLNPDGKVMYLQKYYLKFSKGKVVGGIRLPKMGFGDAPKNVVLEFDWCAQMGSSGSVDAVSLNVELTGAGTCADSDAAVSNAIAHTQETGQMFWQHVKLTLKGVTDATRIEIKPTQFGATSGYYRWFLDNVKVADPEPAKPAVNDVLWKEWWQGAAADQKASEYSASEARTTVAFDNAVVTYTEGGSTALKSDGLVYYDNVANLTDEDYRYNLLVGKGNGYLKAEGIPCNGVKTATLTYRSNSKLEGNHQVTSSTAGVTIGELSATSVHKLDLETKNTYTITCTVTIAEGVKNLDLTITNINAKSNIRVDGLELVATELQ